MEGLAAAAAPPTRRHRERRHRRKASDAAAAALAASFGDVFGGPPRFASAAPADYAEVFGGVAASCSIPYLDLPPATGGGDGAGAGAGGYGEIFGQCDFGEFAVPYDEMLAGPEAVAEEIASPSGSSRSSIRKGSGPLDAETSMMYQHFPDAGCDQQFDEEQFYPVSFPPHNEQTFSMSYNKTTWGKPDDVIEMTTCIVEPSISYVVDSCNLPNDSEVNHVPVMDSGMFANGVNGKVSPPHAATSDMKTANSSSVVDQQQHIPTCLSISENICEDESYNRRFSTHSVSSEEVPSPDYPFLRVSDISLPAASIKVQPPPMPSSKLLNKKGSFENGDSVVNPNSAAAAAAMKEAMEFAEARLKAAKELMERKGDSFKLRKKPAHHRSTKSTEIKESKAPEEVHLFEEELNKRRLPEKESQNHGHALLDANRDGNAVKTVHCDHEQTGILLPEKPQEIMENGNKIEQLGKWTSDAEFYELISHGQTSTHTGAPSKENNGWTKNSFMKLDQFEKEKAGGFVVDQKRSRKLWNRNDAPDLRMEHANLVKDGTASVEVECKAPRSPEVIFSEERATCQEPTDCHLKQCIGVGNSLEVHDNDDGRFDVSCMKGLPAKVHAVPEMSTCFSEACIFGGHASDNKNCSDASIEEAPPEGKCNKDNSNKEGLELPCADEILCNSARSQFLQEHSNTPNTNEVKESQLKIPESEDPAESCETYENQNLFSFVDEACLHNEKERANEVTSDALIGGEMKKIVIEEKTGSPDDEIPLAAKSNKDNSNIEGLENPFAGEIPCTSERSQLLQEHSNIPHIDDKETQVEISESEESAEYCETYDNEKLFSSDDEACLRNEKERANEVTSEALIDCERKKLGTEKKTGAHEDFQVGNIDRDAGFPEKEANVTLGSANADKNEEAELLNLSIGSSKLMKPNVRTCDTFGRDPYQLQESQGSLGSQDLENIMDRFEEIVSHCEEKEGKESLLENVEKITVEQAINHSSKEGQKSMETNLEKRPSDVYANVHVSGDRDGNTFHSVSEVTTDGDSDYAMKMSTRSNSLHASFSEACPSMQCLSQNAESASVEEANKSIPILDNPEEDCRVHKEFSTEKCTEVEEGQKTGNKMEERDGKDSVSNVSFRDQQSFYLDSDSVPKFAEDTASDIVQKSMEENPEVRGTKGRNDVIKTTEEIEEEIAVRLDEDNDRMEKEDKDRLKRELEEEKERERERAKDRLAVRRATKEAHERAFAEARTKAERIALERITSARQRASADAHEKEGKPRAEAAAEKASREARMKAERAAVERANAEARERAIEKAKAAADAKERMERFRSSFKDSFKATNQDNEQDTQFQKRAANSNCGKNMDSCIEVIEVESALRHKAKLERQQRTAERAAKALAEKNMRDMLAQREQAERNRLAEFLDPEVKRWSNGKEGNLRALLSTLQYILGSDSGWQSVPLTDLITAAGVKKAYRKATLCVHPDKLQQRGATIRQKYICEKVFDLLKEAWNKFNSESR
ncbi:hypothetical protein ACP70R_037137 [Stipagrostis hirtigluma subsp. patula]